MSDGKSRETGSRKEISEEVKLAKLRSRLDHTADDLKRLCDELRKHGEYAPPDLVDGLNEAQAKIDAAKKYFTGYHVNVASSFTDTLLIDAALTGIGVISGGRKGARRSGWRINDEERQERFDDMRDWLKRNKERKRGWKARFNRDMKNKWGIEFEAAKKFVDRHIDKLNG